MATSFEEKVHPTIFDPKTCITKGLVTVSKTRTPKSHQLYYELHGDKDGENKIVFIMGLANSCFGWSNQVEYFSKIPGYQVLVFDNRGVGNSESPNGLYRTTDMAKDVRELLEHVGWNDRINVVGVSMGGMIAEELAWDIPERIATLTLTSTKVQDKFIDLPTLKATWIIARLLSKSVPTVHDQIKLMMTLIFPGEYLEETVVVEGEGKVKRVEVIAKDFERRHNLARKQPFKGSIGQLAACLTHKMSARRCRYVGENVKKICIIHGDSDILILPSNAHNIKNLMPNSELVIIKGGGHALPVQIKEEYNEIVKRVVEDGRSKLVNGA